MIEVLYDLSILALHYIVFMQLHKTGVHPEFFSGDRGLILRLYIQRAFQKYYLHICIFTLGQGTEMKQT
jgi:hypothetical protein